MLILQNFYPPVLPKLRIAGWAETAERMSDYFLLYFYRIFVLANHSYTTSFLGQLYKYVVLLDTDLKSYRL